MHPYKQTPTDANANAAKKAGALTRLEERFQPPCVLGKTIDHEQISLTGIQPGVVRSLVCFGPVILATADPLGPHADLGRVRLLPDSDPWNHDVSVDPVDFRSAEISAAIGADLELHEDFGLAEWEGAPTGIPYTVVGQDQPLVPVEFE